MLTTLICWISIGLSFRNLALTTSISKMYKKVKFKYFQKVTIDDLIDYMKPFKKLPNHIILQNGDK